MAAKCTKEKNAWDKAEELVLEREQQWDVWARNAIRAEDDAQGYPNELNRRCRDEPNPAECFIKGWSLYDDMVWTAENFRGSEKRSRSMWQRAIRRAQKAKEKYHRCLDRKRSDRG